MYNWSTLKKLIWLFAAKLNGGDVTKTVSGSPAHITDALAKDALSVLASIEPIQDLHGYSNPWPAGGGKNLLDTQTASTQTASRHGLDWTLSNNVFDVSGISTQDYCSIPMSLLGLPSMTLPAGTYKLYIFGLTGNFRPRLTTATFSQYILYDKSTTLTEETTFSILVSSNVGTGTQIDGSFKLMVVDTSTGIPTVWEPYSNICPISGRTGLSVYVGPTQDQQDATTYAVDWTSEAGTVYGGTVDVVTGVLTVDRALWQKNTATMDNTENYPGWKNSGIKDLIGGGISTPQQATMNIGSEFGVNTTDSNDIAFLRTQTYGKTQTEWISLAQDVQIIVTLATPLTYQLTQQEVQMLLGENYVWSSSGDTVSVTYYAEGNANPLQSLNILLDGNYSNPKTADDVSDKEALEIILGGNK